MDSNADIPKSEDVSGGFLVNIFTNPLNLFLLSICAYLLYKIKKSNDEEDEQHEPVDTGLPPMKKRDLTVAQLSEYDGVKNERILIAVNGKVFDVTNRGKNFYGPGGAYGIFAGHDASRGLAQFRLDKDVIKDEYDDLADLGSADLESVREWEMQFLEKYEFVGKLLKDGEEPTDYSDEEDTAEEKNKDD
ncbi:membrane-associated progesterone receptor component 1-like [Styela clava]